MNERVAISLLFALQCGMVAFGSEKSDPAVQDQPGNEPKATETPDPAKLFEKVSPAVVKLILKNEDEKDIGVASGFVIAAEPREDDRFKLTIVTNFHAIRGVPVAEARFDSGETGTVQEVAAEDESIDLAILYVDAPCRPPNLVDLDRTALPPVGTKIFVIGSPKGLTNSLSEGLVSGYRERDKGDKWVQITAPISPGSSGGPVVTANAHLVGIATASLVAGQNLNFAVPASESRKLLAAGSKPRQLWKGVSIQKERDQACKDALSSFCERLGHDRPPASGLNVSAEMLGKIEASAANGDQLAMMLSGVLEVRKENFDVAASLLRKAVKAPACKYEYLVYYMLGVSSRHAEFASIADRMQLDDRGGFVFDETVHSEAIAALQTARRLNPEFAPTYDELVCCYAERRQLTDAIANADALVSLASGSSSAYVTTGDLRRRLGATERAAQDFQKAIDIDPSCERAWGALSFAYFDMREYTKAIGAYKQILTIESRDKTSDWRLYSSIGNLQEMLGDLEQAALSFEKALNLLNNGGKSFTPKEDHDYLHERISMLRARFP